jgi:hypothetical protein
MEMTKLIILLRLEGFFFFFFFFLALEALFSLLSSRALVRSHPPPDQNRLSRRNGHVSGTEEAQPTLLGNGKDSKLY